MEGEREGGTEEGREAGCDGGRLGGKPPPTHDERTSCPMSGQAEERAWLDVTQGGGGDK